MLLLYIWEPSLLRDAYYAPQHWQFVAESLQCLDQQLEAYGVRIRQLAGEVVPVLTEIHRQYRVETLYSHEETGLRITYDRDKAVANFCRQHDIAWRQYQHNGVQRGLPNRLDLEGRLERLHAASPGSARPAPHQVSDWGEVSGGTRPAPKVCPNGSFQPGGEQAAHRYLHSFFQERARAYSRTISKPEASRRGSGRLSPYLAWGNLSVRTVYQHYRQALGETLIPRRNLLAFGSRLRWHCHFIQKFESEDRMESENVNRAYDAQVKVLDATLFEAWAQGRTGYPLVDACMRCLHRTGHLNFRMRAMLVSFLTHLLWQPWKPGEVHLARLFLDFEPGIHYAQFHMQAGVMGVNTVRIYNPVKQSHDHDPAGHPEMGARTGRMPGGISARALENDGHRAGDVRFQARGRLSRADRLAPPGSLGSPRAAVGISETAGNQAGGGAHSKTARRAGRLPSIKTIRPRPNVLNGPQKWG